MALKRYTKAVNRELLIERIQRQRKLWEEMKTENHDFIADEMKVVAEERGHAKCNQALIPCGGLQNRQHCWDCVPVTFIAKDAYSCCLEIAFLCNVPFCFIPVSGEAIAGLFEIHQCKMYCKQRLHMLSCYTAPHFHSLSA